MFLPLEIILSTWLPGSQPQPWSWDDEQNDIDRRYCCCRSHLCNDPKVGPEGHYQKLVEEYISLNGIPGKIKLGFDGRVWDGHHRIIAAKRLGIEFLDVDMEFI